MPLYILTMKDKSKTDQIPESYDTRVQNRPGKKTRYLENSIFLDTKTGAFGLKINCNMHTLSELWYNL